MCSQPRLTSHQSAHARSVFVVHGVSDHVATSKDLATHSGPWPTPHGRLSAAVTLGSGVSGIMQIVSSPQGASAQADVPWWQQGQVQRAQGCCVSTQRHRRLPARAEAQPRRRQRPHQGPGSRWRCAVLWYLLWQLQGHLGFMKTISRRCPRFDYHVFPGAQLK